MLARAAADGLRPTHAIAGRPPQAVQADAHEDAVAEGDIDQRVERLDAGYVVPVQAVPGIRPPAPVADAGEQPVAERRPAQDELAGDTLEVAPGHPVAARGDERTGNA